MRQMIMTNKAEITFAFFGTSHIATYVLEALAGAGYLPALVVTMPERPKGRGLEPQPSAVAIWAREKNIPVSYDWDSFSAGKWDVAILVDYGKIIPQTLLDIPRMGFLNVHPSLLPRFRGPSPIRSAILNDARSTGVSVIRIDEKMDHGPILAQKKITPETWPLSNTELERALMTEGGALLALMLPEYLDGTIELHEQNHDVATYCAKLTKEDGKLDLKADAYGNLLKIRALEGWPGTYTYFERAGKPIRVQIIDAHIEKGLLTIDTVKPEGKREMPFSEFKRSGVQPIDSTRH